VCGAARARLRHGVRDAVRQAGLLRRHGETVGLEVGGLQLASTQGSIKALLRLYYGAITALLRLYSGSITTLLRLY
jgi:hypothetical protein